MNTTATFIEENNNDHESDSDDATPEYYQPISALADDADSDPDEEQHDESVENGISSLHLNDGVEEHKSNSSSDGEEKEGEEEESVRVREREEAAILRAFREDESRRNAPLSQENASRVIEAMRGISFSGSTPDWAGRVPQDEWILHLQTLRRQQQQQVSFTTD